MTLTQLLSWHFTHTGTDHACDKLYFPHTYPMYEHASQKFIVTLCSSNKTEKKFFINSATSHSVSPPLLDLPCLRATLSSFHLRANTTHSLIITDRPSPGRTQKLPILYLPPLSVSTILWCLESLSRRWLCKKISALDLREDQFGRAVPSSACLCSLPPFQCCGLFPISAFMVGECEPQNHLLYPLFSRYTVLGSQLGGMGKESSYKGIEVRLSPGIQALKWQLLVI